MENNVNYVEFKLNQSICHHSKFPVPVLKQTTPNCFYTPIFFAIILEFQSNRSTPGVRQRTSIINNVITQSVLSTCHNVAISPSVLLLFVHWQRADINIIVWIIARTMLDQCCLMNHDPKHIRLYSTSYNIIGLASYQEVATISVI